MLKDQILWWSVGAVKVFIMSHHTFGLKLICLKVNLANASIDLYLYAFSLMKYSMYICDVHGLKVARKGCHRIHCFNLLGYENSKELNPDVFLDGLSVI